MHHVPVVDTGVHFVVGSVVRGSYRVRGSGNPRRIYDDESPGCFELVVVVVMVFLAWVFL